MGSDDALRNVFDLRIISLAVVIALIVGAGAGYMVGNSPVSSLIEEKDGLEEEYDLLETEHDTLYSYLQSVEAELESAQELLVEEQRDVALLEERYMEMLAIDQENQVLKQPFIELETFLNAYLELKKPYLFPQIEAWDNFRPFAIALDPELDLCIDAIIRDIEALQRWYDEGLELEENPLATDMEHLIRMIKGFSYMGNLMQDFNQFEKVYCNAIRDQIQAEPGLSSASYRGSLDPWYHYMDVSTEEISPQYDAKLLDGSWSLVDLGDGGFRLSMRWTELNINEEVEGAPPGTYDDFIVTLESQDFNAADDSFMLYGDAYWQKINWDGKIGEWTSSGVEVHISPRLYDHEFLYYHSGYVAGFGLLIYGSLYPS